MEPPFARTNPMDSGSDYQVTLSGPDSVHSMGETFRITMTTDPALPADDYEFVWEAGPVYECFPEPPCFRKSPVPIYMAAVVTKGEFSVIDTRADHRMMHATVHFGDVPHSHRVFVGQKAVALDLSCSPWTLPYDPCDDNLFQTADTIRLHARMFDARGHPIARKPGFALERGQVIPRDDVVQSYAMPHDPYRSLYLLNPLRAGATWVVVKIDDAVDSVYVVVE